MSVTFIIMKINFPVLLSIFHKRLTRSGGVVFGENLSLNK